MESTLLMNRRRLMTTHVLRMIDPAIAHLDPRGKDAVNEGVKANVLWTVKEARRIQKRRGRSGVTGLMFVGAIYELKSGKVRFLSDSGKQ